MHGLHGMCVPMCDPGGAFACATHVHDTLRVNACVTNRHSHTGALTGCMHRLGPRVALQAGVGAQQEGSWASVEAAGAKPIT